MIIDRSYFTGLIYLPDVNGLNPNSDLDGNSSLLDKDLKKYEREYLINNLGYTLYKEVLEHLDQTNQQDKIDKLINGAKYQLNGVDLGWRGLIDLNCSPIANYIYVKHLNDNAETYIGTDVVTVEQKNNTPIGYNRKIVRVWREMYDWTVGECKGVTYHQRRGGLGIDWTTGNNTERSLYQFISDMNTIDNRFSTWNPKELLNTNIWGI